MFQHFRHRQANALFRHILQRGGHAGALELSVRRVNGSSLERVHAQLHTENNFALGIIPGNDGKWMAGQGRCREGLLEKESRRADIKDKWSRYFVSRGLIRELEELSLGVPDGGEKTTYRSEIFHGDACLPAERITEHL